MSQMLYIGLAATLLIIVSLSIWTGTQAKKSTSNSTPVVAGVIMGTLVGGSSTVGTAQLAYQFGLSAWWYTLGAGISCLILALVYTKPLRRTGKGEPLPLPEATEIVPLTKHLPIRNLNRPPLPNANMLPAYGYPDQ